MVLPILHYYLGLSVGHRAVVGGLTQTFLPLAYRGVQAVTGHGGTSIGDSRVVASVLPPPVTVVLFVPLPPRRHH